MADAKKKAIKRSPVVSKTTTGKSVAAKKKRELPRFARIVLAPFFGIGRYVGGAWQELRQVRWPDRKATWSLTGAVIVFSLFFAAVILGLDYVFQYLFKEILL